MIIPGPEIQGALDAARDFGEEIILVGNEELVGPRLAELNKSGLPVRIVHAPDVLEMTDKPVDGARKKPLNSMAVGLELVKTGQGSAFVTAGNTGGAMFNGLRTLGRIKGVQRPGLTAVFPTKTGFCAVVDIGANADCRPEFLVQFAIMGSLYAEKLLNIAEPRVGLLSNGEEVDERQPAGQRHLPPPANRANQLHRQRGGQRAVPGQGGCGRYRRIHRQRPAQEQRSRGQAVDRLRSRKN